MTFTGFLFYLFSTVLILSSIRVITAKDPVISAFNLILAFFNTSMLWMLMDAEFLALLLILIYVGAVIVLILFVVMMLMVKPFNPRTKNYLQVGYLVGGILMIEIISVYLIRSKDLEGLTQNVSTKFPKVASLYDIGNLMYTEYAFAVEISGILLLVGMITAISLTMRKREGKKNLDPALASSTDPKNRVHLVKLDLQ